MKQKPDWPSPMWQCGQKIAVHAAFGHGSHRASWSASVFWKYFQFLAWRFEAGEFFFGFVPQAPRGTRTHSSNSQLYTLLEGIRRRVALDNGLLSCYRVHLWWGCLPASLPSSGEQGSAVATFVSSLRDSQHYSIGELRCVSVAKLPCFGICLTYGTPLAESYPTEIV